jgi:hypothetical protein
VSCLVPTGQQDVPHPTASILHRVTIDIHDTKQHQIRTFGPVAEGLVHGAKTVLINGDNVAASRG